MFIRQLPLPELVEHSDEHLLEQYQLTGDARFFSELFGRYAHLVYFMSHKYLADNEDRRDLVMHVFGKLLYELPRAGQIHSFNNWLHTVVRNECLNWQRQGERNVAVKNFFGKSEPKVVENPALPCLNNRGPKIETALRLEIALNRLDPAQQTCIRLFFYEQKSYKEIAQLMAITPKQVKSHLQNGKRRLKRFILKESG